MLYTFGSISEEFAGTKFSNARAQRVYRTNENGTMDVLFGFEGAAIADTSGIIGRNYIGRIVVNVGLADSGASVEVSRESLSCLQALLELQKEREQQFTNACEVKAQKWAEEGLDISMEAVKTAVEKQQPELTVYYRDGSANVKGLGPYPEVRCNLLCHAEMTVNPNSEEGREYLQILRGDETPIFIDNMEITTPTGAVRVVKSRDAFAAYALSQSTDTISGTDTTGEEKADTTGGSDTTDKAGTRELPAM